MARKTLPIYDFTKGVRHKTPLLGPIGLLRLQGLKFSDKPGVLESFGGWENWDVIQDFSELQGIKQWYKSDGSSHLFLFGNSLGNYGVWEVMLNSKTASFIQADTDFDRNAPVLFVNCDDQLVVLPDGKRDRPISIKRNGKETRYSAGLLGLSSPSEVFTVTPQSSPGHNTWLEGNKTYRWALTYSYGTPSEPELYGESDLGPILTRFLPTLSGSYRVVLSDIVPISGLITRINIYRTLGNDEAFFKVGEITQVGVTFWYDDLRDINVDTDTIPPLFNGLPGPIRCGIWFNSRFWYFGLDGVLRASAAGRPDVHPPEYFWVIGHQGYRGNWLAILRDNLYVGKEDGIYLITGIVPNITWKRVSEVQCFSRASMAQMPDGAYFLGTEQGWTRPYRFNGSSAQPIGEEVASIFTDRGDDVNKRAFGRRVGYAYWLSLKSSDKRYVKYPVPFNNLLMCYDIRYNAWYHNPQQAAAIEVLDGPGDKGEVYIIEADPTSSGAKGNLFKWVRNQNTANLTQYTSGVRIYAKDFGNNRYLTLGVIPGIGLDGSLERVYLKGLRIRYKLTSSSIAPWVNVYKDNMNLLSRLQGPIQFEPSQQQAELDVTGDDAGVWNVGKWGSMIWGGELVEERDVTLVDNLDRTGVCVEVEMTKGTPYHWEIEGVEVKLLTGNRE